ncbi:hypothetical protein [Priestia aryabhattai]|uniref:hypothetical protein n=1 Tax=Priestia aryabhattai TaxID=412384 RepID=UPI002E1BC79B|nr:hypothetical protein [Priestia aryabhattai]MED4261358.1 hypothetical protein [Priestia aryabhattai]
MYSTKLSSPIYIDKAKNDKELINDLYEDFKKNLMDREKRVKLFNRDIFVDCKNWITYKNEVFWHLISLSENEKFNILPCNNCASGSRCNSNCIEKVDEVTLTNGQKRYICLYRGIRINWVSEIISLANHGDENIKTWKKEIKKGRRDVVQFYIRFTHDAVDYVILFEEKYKNGELSRYHFITAFPVFYINKKQEYELDYQLYNREQQKKVNK